MGHRLTTALISLNAVGFFACVILIAAYGNQTRHCNTLRPFDPILDPIVYCRSWTSASRLGDRRS